MNADDVRTNPRLSGLVKRYHTWPVIREQNIAEHCWQTMRIYMTLFGLPAKEVFVYVHFHDSGELVTGDPPYPVKSLNPAMKAEFDRLEEKALLGMGITMPKISEEDRRRVKLCEMLEMWEYGFEERARGNAFAGPILEATSSWIAKEIQGLGSDTLRDVLSYMARQSGKMAA